MPGKDSITIPPLLRRLTIDNGTKSKSDVAQHTSSDSVHWSVLDSASVQLDTPNILRLKTRKKFSLHDIHFRDESYFKGSKYFRPELRTTQNGILGDPAPYNVSNDNTVTGLLLGCFLLALVATSLSRDLILRQLKELFRAPRNHTSIAENAYEVRFQTFLVAQTALILSIVYYLYRHAAAGGRSEMVSQLQTMGIYFGIFMGYFLLKYVLYTIVDWTYFSKNKCLQWIQTWLFLTSMEGVLLFPLVLLLVYFSLSLRVSMIYLLTATLLIKLLTVYKVFVIFFKRTNVSLQIILYFCALELMPLTALGCIMIYTENYLTINF